MEKLNERDQHDAQQIADKALADCGGNEPAARILLAHLLINARRGMCSGFQRLGQMSSL